MGLALEALGFPKRYNSGHSDIGCKICTNPTEHFLRATSPLIHAASLSTSQEHASTNMDRSRDL